MTVTKPVWQWNSAADDKDSQTYSIIDMNLIKAKNLALE